MPGKRTTLRAPLATLRAVRTTRRILREFRPELVFVWNGTDIPQAAIRVAETAGVPVVYSIAEHWFARLYLADPFMRYLFPGERGVRALWGLVIRLVNRHPSLRLEVERKVPALADVDQRGPAPQRAGADARSSRSSSG